MSTRVLNYFVFFALCTVIAGCASTENINKEKADLRMQNGVAHIQNDNLPLALKELLIAEELDPENPLIHNNLGLVYFLRQKFELSIKHFSKAVQLKNNFTEAKNNLARVYIEVKQYSKAEQLLNEVVSDLTYGNLAGAYMNYGLMRFAQNRFADAKTLFRKVLEWNREDCYGQVYYGRSFLELGQTKDAADQLDKATPFCLVDKIDEAHYYSAIAHYRSGNKDKALARFNETIKLFPQGTNLKNAEKMILMIKRGVQ